MSPSPADMPNRVTNNRELWEGVGEVTKDILESLSTEEVIVFAWLAWSAALRRTVSNEDIKKLGPNALDTVESLRKRGMVMLAGYSKGGLMHAIMPGYTPPARRSTGGDPGKEKVRRDFLSSLEGRPTISGIRIPDTLPPSLLSRLEELAKDFKFMPRLPLEDQVELTKKQLRLFREWHRKFPKNKRVGSEIDRIEATLATRMWELENHQRKKEIQ